MFATVAAATAVDGDVTKVGDELPDVRHPGGPVPSCRGGARARGTGCRSRRASDRVGQSRAAAWTSVALGNVTMPENDSMAPRSRQRRASSGPPVKQWKIVCSGTPMRVEDVERVVPGVAGVDHEREVDRSARGRSARRRRAVARPAASARSSSRDRPRRRPRCRGVSSRSMIVSTPLTASCGCSPTVANTCS